jgi:6-phosphogluconolactonase
MESIIRPSQPDNNRHQLCRWHGYPSTPALELEAAQEIFNDAQLAIKQRGAFHLVLPGGTTPRRVYELLRNKITDWSRWHIYFGDERCLPASHPERNSRMVKQAWLDHVNIPAGQIHIIPAELGAEQAAKSYANTLSKIEWFDLVLLGLGEDGHTASLFPNHEWGITPESSATLAVLDAPKPPPERVSLTARRLSQTGKLIFLVTGNSKKNALQDWMNRKSIPACAIAPLCGVDIFLEQELLNALDNPANSPCN